MTTRTPAKAKKLVLAFTLILDFCLVCSFFMYLRCEWRRTPPEAPVYPDSIKVDEVIFIGGLSPLATYTYTTTASPEDIMLFYGGVDECNVENNQITHSALCTGRSTPFGEYAVYIDLESNNNTNPTTYVLEMRWQGCTYNLE